MNVVPLRVALIGSFRHHYPTVLAAIDTFSAAGCTVTSPARSRVLDENQEFVRFEHDPPHCDDAEIQAIAMDRILTSHVVFVVDPEGYVGRTTCYEIGQILHQGGLPIFFEHKPLDLPIVVTPRSIMPAIDLANLLRALGETSDTADNIKEHLLEMSGGTAPVSL